MTESHRPDEVTRILADMRDLPHEEVVNRLLPLVYEELRAMAAAQLRHERADYSLQATALVHEAYVRLIGKGYPNWVERRHFFHAAGEAMRRLLIDRAREKGRLKRGARPVHVSLTGLDLADERDPEEWLALDDAIQRLKGMDPTAGAVVHLRFFSGLSVAETAAALDVSERTVKRQWAFARAWLFDALGGAGGGTSEEP